MGLDEEVGGKEMKYQLMKNPKQGGFKATYFLFAMMFMDNIGFVANMASIVLYFMYVIKFDYSSSATTTTNFLGTTFLLTVVGGFISDTYMTRLNTAITFGGIQLMGYTLLIVQSHYPNLQPRPCPESTCIHGTKALLFYVSICLVALGGGGIRGCIPALGADQFDSKNTIERKNIARFFNWFLLSITLGASLGVTFVVYVSTVENKWDIAYGMSICCSFIGLLFVVLGKPYYRVRVAGESPLVRVVEVLVVAVKNWRVEMPGKADELYEIGDRKLVPKGELIARTSQFRFLDKAAVLPNNMDHPMKWKVCTVTQVEEVKILARMMPIFLSTVLMNTCLAQLQTVSVQQGTLMNTKIGRFVVPVASIPVIPLLFMSLLIPVYEFIFVPALRKITGHPNGITYLQRVGVGLVLSAISMGVAGLIEVKRKHEILHHHHKISLFWLSFHYAIFGVADMFTLIGLMDFFYREAPIGMRSLSTSFSFMSLSIGYFLNSAFISLTNLVSRRLSSNNVGWLESRDMNTGHVERFYWFLAILSVANFLNYMFWAHWYKYKSNVELDEEMLIRNGGEGNDDSYTSAVNPSTVFRAQDEEQKEIKVKS